MWYRVRYLSLEQVVCVERPCKEVGQDIDELRCLFLLPNQEGEVLTGSDTTGFLVNGSCCASRTSLTKGHHPLIIDDAL